MTLKNMDRIPPAAIPVLERHTTILMEILFIKLTGVYLHGSAAMGGFSPQQSDIDYVAVVSRHLDAKERRQLALSFLNIFGVDVPANGIEMSIVLERFAGADFRHPTPYEFHFGTKEQIRFHGSPHDFEMVDPDLAAHFTIIKNRGTCLYGSPIDEVFAKIPGEFYLRSIVADAEECFRNIQSKTGEGMCHVPVYAVLNFCRVLAFVKEELITSKIEGAEWGLSSLPLKFQPIILAARDEYAVVGEPQFVSDELLVDFAGYARKEYLKDQDSSRSLR